MAIPISNQRISHPAPLPKVSKPLGGSLLDIAIVGGLVLIVPPLSLLVFLMTPILSFLVKRSANIDSSVETLSDSRDSSE